MTLIERYSHFVGSLGGAYAPTPLLGTILNKFWVFYMTDMKSPVIIGHDRHQVSCYRRFLKHDQHEVASYKAWDIYKRPSTKLKYFNSIRTITGKKKLEVERHTTISTYQKS